MTIQRLEKFMSSSWAQWLHPFFITTKWGDIQTKLQYLKSRECVLAPLSENIFRAFKESNFYTLNTVIIADNPYSDWDPASGKPIFDGIAFSSKDSSFCPKPLENILYSLDDLFWSDTYPYLVSSRENYDLKSLANQGYLMINSSLTTTMKGPVINGMQEHYDIWSPFISEVCRAINLWKSNICVVLIGKNSQNYAKYFTNQTFNLFLIDNPTKENIKEYEEMFRKIHKIHLANNINIDYSKCEQN